jgi:hypothetical protein
LEPQEREALLPDLERRGLSPSMLDVIPPNGRYFQLMRAISSDGELLGATSLMSFPPFIAIKQLLGEGNHVGWDTGIYYRVDANRPQVAAALLRAMAGRSLYYALFFGRLDDDIRDALPLLRHRLLETGYRLGQIDCTRYSDHSEFLSMHKRLRRHLRDHKRWGGTVHIHEGPVSSDIARQFCDLVYSTYMHHGGIGRWQFKEYAYRVCYDFFINCVDAVHIFTKQDGTVNGLQSYIRHCERLELSEGGFNRSQNNHHAYEAIIAESVAYAVRSGLQQVGYGGIWNAGKDRYTDAEPREKIYLLQLYTYRWQYRIMGDRLSGWAFRKYFGNRFKGASGSTSVVSRLADP